MTPDGKTAYVTNQTTVTPIDTATTCGYSDQCRAGTKPFRFDREPGRENTLCGVSNGGGSLATIDTATNTMGPSIARLQVVNSGICSNGNALLRAA